VRILLEGRLEIGLHTAIEAALSLQPVDKLDVESLTEQLHGFVTGRLRSLYVDQAEVSVEVFDAVDRLKDRANMPLPDFDQRIAAVRAFARMAEAESLAAANKRISNILAQADAGGFGAINVALLQESAEKQLFDALDEALADVRPLQESREYAAVLARLARLKDPVDRFFDEVMVMTDDEALKTNRLALLSRLREPFHSVADISRLSASRP
jgi:glycyl-tRNA synthetase beta chain